MKKTRIDSNRKWKVCLMKVPLFLLKKMHWDQDISIFIFFSSYPFGGILDTLPLLRFWFSFFCFFTCNQPQIYLSAAEKIDDFFNFHYALVFIMSILAKPFSKPWYHNPKQINRLKREVDTAQIKDVSYFSMFSSVLILSNWVKEDI